jgi:hypothetical protein
MKLFLVVIGTRRAPRLRFEAMAADSISCLNQHLELVKFGERVEVVAL